MAKNEENWRDNYEALKSYIAEHGHLPNHHKPENRNLHSWARYQKKRIKAGKMTGEQKVLFEILMDSRVDQEGQVPVIPHTQKTNSIY